MLQGESETHIGVDLDNTIVCYDRLFYRVALEWGVVPERVAVSWGGVREFLLQSSKEDVWLELQGYVYGALMHEAIPFPGSLDFFIHCKHEGISACIVSHRSPHPFKGPPYDLHQAAHEWLKIQGFYDPGRGGLSPSQVFFEPTPQGKLDRIAQVGCTHFIDDLPQFLTEPGFPPGVERILFDSHGSHHTDVSLHRVASWKGVKNLLWSANLSW